MPPDLQGTEFDWFAVDSNGHIALFATAGEGFVPEAVIHCYENHSVISDSLPTPRYGTPEVWGDYADLGLFVLDWALPGGPYEMRAVPRVAPSEELKKKILAVPELPKFNGSFINIKRVESWQ